MIVIFFLLKGRKIINGCLMIHAALICLVDANDALVLKILSGSGNLPSSYLVFIHGRETNRILMSLLPFWDKPVSQSFGSVKVPSR